MKLRLILIAIAAVAVVGGSVALVYAWESPIAPVAPSSAGPFEPAVVNPDGIRNKVEGGMLQALSWTLFERMTFDRTRVTSIDWSAYPILRFGVVPGSIDVHIIERLGDSFFGVAEAAQGPSGAALANAIRDATGLPLRELPFTASKIKSAIGL